MTAACRPTGVDRYTRGRRRTHRRAVHARVARLFDGDVALCWPVDELHVLVFKWCHAGQDAVFGVYCVS